jgi:hypothetical protein
MKLRILDAGFLPGRVFLAEDYLPEDREALKIEMQKASSIKLVFDDARLVLRDSLCGSCYRVEDSGMVAILIPPAQSGDPERLLTFVHEMLHATFELFRNAEVKPSAKSEEAYAYLQEYLLRQTGEF